MTADTLGQVIGRKALEHGDRPALEYAGRTTSFKELDRSSDTIAKCLAGGGGKAEGRIAYLGKNSDTYFHLLFGAAKAGMVMVPIGWRSSDQEIAYLLTDSGAHLLFVEEAFLPVAQRATAGMEMEMIVVEQGAEVASSVLRRLSLSGETSISLPSVTANRPVLQLYTSGTTGRPKGAMLTHANLFALRSLSAEAGLDWDRWDATDVSLLTMPVAHIAGTGWGLIALYNGAKSIILSEFDAGKIIRLISTEPVSRMFLVPTAILAVLRHPDVANGDYSRLRYILYGASPIPLAILTEAVDRFHCGFVQNYGMTETSGTVVALAPDDHDAAGNPRMKSAGKPMPGVQIRVIDGDGHDLPAHQTGEILVSSPSNMAGYWQRPQATAEALLNGWMRTGDAGYLDEDGYLYICDRVKDMIISGGENIYPAEVENVLHAHPMVADVAIIGIPDPRWGEAVTAFVVAASGDGDPAEIIAWAREKMAAYKVPKQVHFVAALPRNANGKLLKRVLREPFWEGRGRAIN